MRKYIYHFVLIALLLTSCTPMENPVVKFYGVSLNNEILAIGYGDSYQLTASVLPGRSSDKVTFEWTSNNAAVAEVDDNGLVTAQNHGEAIITVTASFEGTSFSSTCAVTVIPVDVYIPDDNFRNYCLENFDTNGDGVLSSTETVSVYDLRVSNTGIISLEGIQYFKSLNLIYCGSNQLESLDVSQNTNLKDLICSGNQLIALDVSQNALLTRLDCSYNQLIDLDVSQNSLLGRLICTYNQLTTLDVSQNSHLLELECWYNQLTALDVSQNTLLSLLYCSNNQLTALDVSQNTLLRFFYCSNNQLTSLDVSLNTAIVLLDCSYNQLSALDLSHNSALELFYCGDNQLTSLDLSNNPDLGSLSCMNNPNLLELWLKTGHVLWRLTKDNYTVIKYKD